MCARHKSTELLKLFKYSTAIHCMNNQTTMVSVLLINDLTFQSSPKDSPGPSSTLSAFSSTALSIPPIPLVYFYLMLRSFVILLSLQDGTPSFIPCVCPSITLAIKPYTVSTNCLWIKYLPRLLLICIATFLHDVHHHLSYYVFYVYIQLWSFCLM